MAEDTSGGKESTTLYCRSFPYGSGVIGSLYLSKDGQLCMLTGSGVHILRPKSPFPDFSTPLKFSIGLLKNPGNENGYDVGINTDMFCLHPPEFEESYTFVLDRSLNPNKVNLTPPTFIEAAWSPDVCCCDGSSLLAVLSSGNRIYYVKKDTYTNNYVITLDITQKLYENFRANDYKDKNIKESVCESRNKLSSEFDEYKRRQYYLAITGIHWCPCSFTISHCEDLGNLDRSNQDTYALLCGCNKLGMLIIWKVNIPALTDELTVEFLESITVSDEEATTVTWHQDSSSSTGYIAIAFSNGFISVCVIKTIISNEQIAIKKIQKIDLWNEDDLMQVPFMQWVKKDSCLYLVSTKQSNIIVFRIELDSLGNISSHSYSVAPSHHEVAIVALSCKEDSVLTTGEDGNTEHWQLGQNQSTIVKSIYKPGYRSFGMQLSNDGLMLFHVLYPTSIIYTQAKAAEKIELVVTTFKPLQTIAERVNDNMAPVDFEWYEVCRVVTNQIDFHPILQAYALSSVDESVNIAQLQKIAFVKWLSAKRQPKSATSEYPMDSPDFQLVLKKVLLERVKYAIEFLKNSGEIDENSRTLTLLAADWLVTNGNQIDFNYAITVYGLLNGAESRKQAEAIRAHRCQIKNEDEKSKQNSGTMKIQMPAREVCPLCKGKIFLEEETKGSCDKGHNWKRCSLTLFILTDMKYRKCIFCRRSASKKHMEISNTSQIYRNYTNVNRCCLCNSRLIMCG